MRKLLAALLLAAALPALAAPMTNDDVIKLVRGGLSDATVIQAIDAAEPAFDTSPDGLVKLKQGGASEAVIQRILTRGSGKPAPAAAAAAPPLTPCIDCGAVTAVREVQKKSNPSGVGAVAGGVLGGVVGRQIGGRDHRTAGTVVGAVGGAVAGHQVERHMGGSKTWEVAVRFDDGTTRTFTYETQPRWQAGDKVRIVNGALAPQ